MQIFLQVRKKNEKQWILKTVYSKRLVYFFQKSFLNLVFFLDPPWRGFVIKKFMLQTKKSMDDPKKTRFKKDF